MVVLLDHTASLPDVCSLVSGMQYPEQTRDPIAFLQFAYVCLTVIHYTQGVLYNTSTKIVIFSNIANSLCFAFMDESHALIANSYTVHQFDTRDDYRRDDSLLFQDGTDGQRVVGSHLPLN